MQGARRYGYLLFLAEINDFHVKYTTMVQYNVGLNGVNQETTCRLLISAMSFDLNDPKPS